MGAFQKYFNIPRTKWKTDSVSGIKRHPRWYILLCNNFNNTDAAERQAVNTTIQGSAADIVKAAMVAIDNNIEYDTNENRARLILQLHDELIYEVPEIRKDSFASMLKNTMENTIQLNVPLPVKVKIGYSWGTLESVTI